MIPCPNCVDGIPPQRLCVAGWYDGALLELVLRAKWAGCWASTEFLGDWTARSAQTDGWDRHFECWCAVPRDVRRWIRWGTPLSEQLGMCVSRRLGLPRVRPPGRRKRPPQAGLPSAARRTNLVGAFVPSRRPRRDLLQRRVLLIDDVMTTGSTVRACAQAILDSGASEVGVLVAASSPRK